MSSTALTQGTLPADLVALPSVYRPQGDTHLLAAALAHEDLGPRTNVLEMSWPAVVTARINALRNRLPLRVLHGDFAERTEGRRFDLVMTNPPYVPAPATRLPSHGPQRAWDAGPDGRMVIDRVCDTAPVLLHPWWCPAHGALGNVQA